MNVSRPLWLAASVLLLSGCQAAQVARQGNNFRQAILDIYTEQALDNLIRARIGMPFVQLKYRDLLMLRRRSH